MKIKWKVQAAPVGRYKSFERRGWPLAESDDGRTLFAVSCADDYIPTRVKTGSHAPLKLRVAVYNKKTHGFDWATLNREFSTLADLKDAATEFAARRPEVFANVKE